MRRTVRLAAAFALAVTTLAPATARADPMPSLGALSVGEFFAGQATITRFHDCMNIWPGVCVAARFEQGTERATGAGALRGVLWFTQNHDWRYSTGEMYHGYGIGFDRQLWTDDPEFDVLRLAFDGSPTVLRDGDTELGRPAPFARLATMGLQAVNFDAGYSYLDSEGTDWFIDGGGGLITRTVTTTPEPATLALVGGGVLLVGATARRTRRRAIAAT